jgi:hypothetical protein
MRNGGTVYQRVLDGVCKSCLVHTDKLSISAQLYSSKYQFLYKLLQNADDSRYTKPAVRTPCLAFRVTPSKFIVETNEEGFKRARVEAICANSINVSPSSNNSANILALDYRSTQLLAVSSAHKNANQCACLTIDTIPGRVEDPVSPSLDQNVVSRLCNPGLSHQFQTMTAAMPERVGDLVSLVLD